MPWSTLVKSCSILYSMTCAKKVYDSRNFKKEVAFLNTLCNIIPYIVDYCIRSFLGLFQGFHSCCCHTKFVPFWGFERFAATVQQLKVRRFLPKRLECCNFLGVFLLETRGQFELRLCFFHCFLHVSYFHIFSVWKVFTKVSDLGALSEFSRPMLPGWAFTDFIWWATDLRSKSVTFFFNSRR